MFIYEVESLAACSYEQSFTSNVLMEENLDSQLQNLYNPCQVHYSC